MLILVFAASGFAPSAGAPATQGSAALLQVVVELTLAAYALGGMYLRGHGSAELIGKRAWLDWPIGLAVAAVLLGLSLMAQRLWPAPLADARLLVLPQTLLARALWIPVAAVVAVCEELVFRGYLQRQLEAWGTGFALAALIQAALFAAAHANQGPLAALGVGLCGLLFAGLVRARGGLLVAIVAHFALDACAAFWAY